MSILLNRIRAVSHNQIYGEEKNVLSGFKRRIYKEPIVKFPSNSIKIKKREEGGEEDIKRESLMVISDALKKELDNTARYDDSIKIIY
jgi:hypothetical protein